MGARPLRPGQARRSATTSTTKYLNTKHVKATTGLRNSATKVVRHKNRASTFRKLKLSSDDAGPSSFGTGFDEEAVWEPMDADLVKVDDAPMSKFNKVPITIKKRKRYDISDRPLLVWCDKFRQSYLDAELANEGRGRFWGFCSGPGCTRVSTHRCLDCGGAFPSCGFCLLGSHLNEPLHRFQKWNDSYFEEVSQGSLGICFQLGHFPGVACPFPSSKREFVVLSVNGLHTFNIRFCRCSQVSDYEQLIAHRWWPGSSERPAFAATYEVMRLLHALNLHGKLTPTAFFRAMGQLTDSTGLNGHPKRLPQLMVMLRQWRHIKMCKRAGRGHDVLGIEGTKAGELSLPCRLCPQPEINLPEDWRMVPSEKSFLYKLIIATDACFRQAAKELGPNHNDPILGPGWGTFVDHGRYKEFREERAVDDEDVGGHCRGFASPWKGMSKRTKGTRASGIGSVVCARHEALLANGTGDLQKGERYACMDYMILSSLTRFHDLRELTVSYDKGCHWSINFGRRMTFMPEILRVPRSMSFSYVVPKWHLIAHIIECQVVHSFNYSPGHGRTDGEGIERIWSELNGVAPSASQMGLGGRYDTIDDFCNHHNYRKILSTGDTMYNRLAFALPQLVLHHRAFLAFTAGLMDSGEREQVHQWYHRVEQWEKMPQSERNSNNSPYMVPEDGVSYADVKRALAEIDHKHVEQGQLAASDITPSDFVVSGLNLEEAMHNLQTEAAIKSMTVAQATTLQRNRTLYLRRLTAFRKTQHAYMPLVVEYLRQLPPEELATSEPENIPLLLPSSFDTATRDKICGKNLSRIEKELRFAQLGDALHGVRNQLKVRSIGNRYRTKYGKSQRMNVNIFSLFDLVRTRLQNFRRRYNTARKAYMALVGPGTWEEKFRELQNDDLIGLQERSLTEQERKELVWTRVKAGVTEEDIQGELSLTGSMTTLTKPGGLELGEGMRTISWIWQNGYGDDIGEELRIEWLKSRRRCESWREEVLLLNEEMRRALATCAWMERTWKKRAQVDRCVPSHVQDGLAAYAMEQAVTEHRRGEVWEKKWDRLRHTADDIVRCQVRAVSDILEDNAGAHKGGGFNLDESPLEIEVDDDDALAEEWEDVEFELE